MRKFYFSHVLPAFFAAMLLLLFPVYAVAAPETEKQTETETEAAQSGAVIHIENGKSILYDSSTGKAVKGKLGINEYPAGSGDYYFFKTKDGEIFVKKWIKANGKAYRSGKDGKLYSGIVKIGKRLYYFNRKTHARGKLGWKKLDGIRYYTNENGVVQTGLKKIKKYTYYLDPEKNGAKTVGWKKIAKKTYYFNKRGRMQTGIVSIDGFRYYFNEKGIRRTGLITVNGSRYFFNKSKGGAMATGWITRKNKKYYFAPSTGKAVIGWMTLNNKKYYFNAKGIMQKGWLSQGDRKYYLSPSTGAMYTGKHKIDGKTYDFGKDGYLSTPTGPWSIKVNQGTGVVTVYRGSTAVKAMLCSVGLNGATPNGTFSLGVKRHWHELFGGVYGQYTTVITGNILFHSVYYKVRGDNNSLYTAEFNKLGSPASHGCVRLSCADAYYIYSNCPAGTPVTIFRGSASDDPLPRPAKLTISTSYDPTDPITND